jgi:ethanolamine utilization protein EutJ
MNEQLKEFLAKAGQAITDPQLNEYRGKVHVGVDLGTAYTVLFVLDENFNPLIGVYEYSEVVRDGVVVDFSGATALLRKLKNQVEEKLGFPLTSAATAFPPGVPTAEIRANRYVLESAGLECSELVDEPTAANAVLRVEHGAVVDIGGGTTGIAVIQNGKVIYTADEPTGGTQFSLVIAGRFKIPFNEAEALKTNLQEQGKLFTTVRPVMEKIGTIVDRHIFRFSVDHIYLVGGTSAFPGIAEVISSVTGVPTSVPGNPLFVTPLGIAMYDP